MPEPHDETPIVENNDDSGCMSDSIECSSAYEDHQQDLPRSNSPTGSPEYSRCPSSSSSRTLAAPSCPPRSSSGALLDELIYRETIYLNLLQQYRAADTPEPLVHIEGVQVADKLYLRHAIFIQTLRRLREQRSGGALICPEQIMISLIKFWSQREVIDLYHQATSYDDKPEAYRKSSSLLKPPFSRTTTARELGEIARNHVSFLASYLKVLVFGVPTAESEDLGENH
ncbi:hypothetical protein RvY_08910-2 [Ramazzottius varieornatus]|uniref:Uncharacterized protein n=1 Tax=Ramazzottius varieornatus TaxID=947166 RepID=A0A1D1V7H4_RAMVA|nr:hypothetical protein RvY_08910-2 [Ramazzottius varieornatus]